jgi:hypothetical protein
MKRNLLENTLGKVAIVAVNNDGTAITGVTIDRLGYQSCKVLGSISAASGSPNAATAAILLRHGAASNMSDQATFYTIASALDVDPAAQFLDLDIDLSGAKRYIDITFDTTYTAGTSPTNDVCFIVLLGDKSSEPNNAADNV